MQFLLLQTFFSYYVSITRGPFQLEEFRSYYFSYRRAVHTTAVPVYYRRRSNIGGLCKAETYISLRPIVDRVLYMGGGGVAPGENVHVEGTVPRRATPAASTAARQGRRWFQEG